MSSFGAPISVEPHRLILLSSSSRQASGNEGFSSLILVHRARPAIEPGTCRRSSYAAWAFGLLRSDSGAVLDRDRRPRSPHSSSLSSRQPRECPHDQDPLCFTLLFLVGCGGGAAATAPPWPRIPRPAAAALTAQAGNRGEIRTRVSAGGTEGGQGSCTRHRGGDGDPSSARATSVTAIPGTIFEPFFEIEVREGGDVPAPVRSVCGEGADGGDQRSRYVPVLEGRSVRGRRGHDQRERARRDADHGRCSGQG